MRECLAGTGRHLRAATKVEEWLDHGCRMVVVTNPRNRTLKVYRSRTAVIVLTTDDTFDGSDVVPGFRLPVRQIFPE